jgi:four helix bundle protein
MKDETEGRMKDENEARITDLKLRTKQFGLRIIRLFSSLPQTALAQTLGKQVLRSGTSVGAHYREGVRSRSTAEFISKLEGGLQELEETAYWLELISEAEIFPAARLADLQQEVDELLAIFTTCVKNAKQRRKDEG